MPSESPSERATRALRIGSGTQPPQTPLIPRWIRLLLYPVFWVLLLIPALRRLRRDARRWNFIRFAALGTALGGSIVSVWWGAWGLVVPGGLVAATALLLRPSSDPDRERDLQRRHQADYLLNGGKLAARWPASLGGHVASGTALYVLVRGREILFVPVDSVGGVTGTIRFTSIQEILVNGETYRPVYVSEAKDPPVRELAVDRKATARMTLVVDGGERLDFEYQGAFSKHLAESAAHALYSVRKLGTAHGVAGESPEIFHIVGR